MLEKNRSEDLKNIFRLFQRVELRNKDQNNILLLICSRFQAYIQQTGQKYISDVQSTEKIQPIPFVLKIIKFKKKIDDITNSIFQKKPDFIYYSKQGFQQFLNQYEHTSKFLAVYSNYLHKKLLRNLEENEKDMKIQEIASIISFLHDKDKFHKFYIRYLADRLLNRTSVDEEAEKQLIIELKKDCDRSEVKKLEQMNDDIEFSKELNNTFQKSKLYKVLSSNKVTMNVSILQSGSWPDLSRDSNIDVPSLMEKYTNAFKMFYNQRFKNSERKLTWIMAQGKSEVEFNTFQGEKVYILMVSNLQLAILLLLNTIGTSTYEQISNTLKMKDALLQESLFILCNKTKVLTRSVKKQKKFNQDETIGVNINFSHRATKINCNLQKPKRQSKKPSKEDNKIINEIKRQRHI